MSEVCESDRLHHKAVCKAWRTEAHNATLLRIEQKLDTLLRIQPKLVSTEQAMEWLACDSDRSFRRIRQQLGIQPFRKGKYLLTDLENAVARAIYSK